MAAMTLGDLIVMVREETISFKADLILRDGDSTDARNATVPIDSISITRAINNAVALMVAEFKYAVENKTIATVIGTREYTIPTDYVDIISVWIGTTRLRKTTQAVLDGMFPRWRSTANGTPYQYYVSGSAVIGFDIPPVAIVNVNINACVDVAVLSLLASVPAYLPTVFHPMIAWRAACLISEMDADNPVAQRRAQALMARYAEMGAKLKGLMAQRLEFSDEALGYEPVQGGPAE